MTDRLKDKIAIVFGAGSIGPGWGNGKATAVLFARNGAKAPRGGEVRRPGARRAHEQWVRRAATFPFAPGLYPAQLNLFSLLDPSP